MKLMRPASLMALSLSILLFVAPHACGQDTYYVCDSANDSVYRMVDGNSDGSIDPATEVSIFYDDASPGLDLSVPNHLLPYAGGLLLCDGGTLDAILLLKDLNGDGDANDAGEMTIFYDDSSPGPDLSVPNGLARAPDGSIFVCDDSASVRAIFHMVDLNGDGDANDDGEAEVFYDTTAVSPPMPIWDPESIIVDAAGIVYVGDTNYGWVFRCEDTNGDGDAMDEDETTIFYSVAGPIPLTDIDALQIDSAGAMYVINEDDGTVLRLIDLNDDGDALDAGEALQFLDGTAPGAVVTDPNDAVILADGKLLLGDGLLDALIIAEDLDGNGVATDAGEVYPLFDDGGLLLSTPSGLAFISGSSPPLPPVVDAVTPDQGPVSGGTDVTVTGTSFTGTTAVYFGPQAAQSFQVVSPTTVLAVTPAAAAAGPVDVTVVTPAGESTLPGGFLYYDTGNMFITSVNPGVGSVAGGDPVTIHGSGWDPVAPLEVFFDGLSAVVTSAEATAIAVLTPPHPPALVDVQVTQNQESAISSGAYRYQTPFVRGDVNRDGILNLSDPLGTLNYLFIGGTPPPPCLDALDIDDDDRINIADAVALLTYLFVGGAPPAPPFPDPGFDPTPLGPGCAG